MEKLNYLDYPDKGYIEIEGINYSYEFFKKIGKDLLLNQPFVIVERKDGIVLIETYSPKKGD